MRTLSPAETVLKVPAVSVVVDPHQRLLLAGVSQSSAPPYEPRINLSSVSSAIAIGADLVAGPDIFLFRPH